MVALRAHLLGGFRVEADGAVVQLSGSRHARSLLAYLLLSPDRQHLRTKLAGMYWPDQPESVARERLRSVLWRIGRSFEATDQILEQAREWVGISPNVDVWVDATELRRLASQAGQNDQDAGALLQRAVDLYEGEFMPGHYEDWVFEEQQSLHSLQAGLLNRLLTIREAQGQFDRALVVAKRKVALDHLDEGAHRDVMRLYAVLRRPEESLSQYREIRRSLKYEMKAEPAPATAQLAADIASHVESNLTSVPTADRSQAPVFVARQAERDLLIGLLEGALGGVGALGLVEGPPGVGKSSLLEQAGEDARWRNFEILRGSYQDRVGGEAFEGIRAAIEAALTPLRIEQLRTQCDPMWLEEASRVVPRLGMASAASTLLVGDEGRWKVLESIVQVLKGLAAIYPTMLILEDVHWADVDSLAVMKQLADSLRGSPLVILLSYRREEAEAGVDRWRLLGELDRSPFTRRLVLSDLGVGSISRLIEAIGGFGNHASALAEMLIEQTGGNPLFVIETLKSLREDDPARAFEMPKRLPVASSVAEIVEHRLAKLGPVERQVIDAAAVFARPVSAAQLADLTDLEYTHVLDAVTRVVRRQVLSDQPEGLLFSHELIRRVAYDGVHPDRLHELHVRSAELLMDMVAAPAEISHHFHEAREWDEGARWSRRAGDAAAQLAAYDTARTHYERALEAAEQAKFTGVDLFDILIALERVVDLLGDRETQTAILDRIAAVAVSPDEQAEVALRKAWFLAHTDRFVDAERTALEGRDIDATGARDFALVLGQIQIWSGRPAQAVATLEEVVDGIGKDVDGQTRQLLGTAYAEADRLEAAEEQLKAAIRSFQSVSDRAREARATGTLGTVKVQQGEIAAAEAALRRGQTMAREVGYRLAEAECSVNLATVLYIQNRPMEAVHEYRIAKGAFESIGQQRGVAAAKLNLASLELHVFGHTTKARDGAAEALSYYEASGDQLRAAQARSVLASAQVGEDPLAFDQIADAIDWMDKSGDTYVASGAFLAFLGLLLEYGELDRARPYFGKLASQVVADADPRLAVIEAWAALDRGEADSAVRQLAATLESLDPSVRYGSAIAWRIHLVAPEGSDLAHVALDRAVALFRDVVENLPPDELEITLAYDRHRRMLAEYERHHAQSKVYDIPRAGVPGGRPAQPDELVAVELTVSHPGDGDIADGTRRRRHRLQRMLLEMYDQDAVPAIKHLARVLDVSQATIKRDLAALRVDGVDVRTRGNA